MKLIDFSNSLTVADFQTDLDSIAIQFSIEPGHHYTLNGDFQKPKIDDRAYRGRTGYIGEWRETRLGARFPRVTFYTQRHGGESIVFDGFKVVMDLYRRANGSGCTIASNSAPVVAEVKNEPVDEREVNRRRSAIQQLWKSALPANHAKSEPLRRYLLNRGLSEVLDAIPTTIRFHPALEYRHQQSDGVWVSMGHFPAMVAAVQTSNDRCVNVHRTFLSADGRKARIPDPDDAGSLLPSKKLMRSAVPGESKGAAIRLRAVSGIVALAEGIETALAVQIGTGLPTWATVSAGGMRSVVLPKSVRKVLIFADLDRSGTGSLAAHDLQNRLLGEGRVATVVTPDSSLLQRPNDKDGDEVRSVDWLDVMNANPSFGHIGHCGHPGANP